MHTSKLLSTSLGALAAISLFGGVASAADMAVKAPPPPPGAGCTWCGFYIGGNAGYVDAQSGFSTVSNPTPDALLGLPVGVTAGLAALSTGSTPIGDARGLIGGVQAGYNWQLGAFLAGIETDIQGLSRSGRSATVTSTANVLGPTITSTQIGSVATNYLGTVRGRLGLVSSPALLLYVTGGLAYGGVRASDAIVQIGTNGYIGAGSASVSQTRTGWTAGAGAEWMFAAQWSFKGEYLHYDLGSTSFAGNLVSPTFAGAVVQTNVSTASFRGDIARVGVNYHFSGPVLAKN